MNQPRKTQGVSLFFLIFYFFSFCCFLLCNTTASLAEKIPHWLNQTVYVPLYSHIYADERSRDKPFNLAATLSIRNTDFKNTCTLKSVDYYDSKGQLLKKYLAQPQTIAPLATATFIVQEAESKGGTGAKFVLLWSAKKAITAPIIESIMIGTKLNQGISFLSRGQVVAGTTAP